MKLKLNFDLNGYKAGEIIDIKDKNGIPTDKYWRKRLRDAVIDNCVEVMTDKKSKKKEVSDDNDK